MSLTLAEVWQKPLPGFFEKQIMDRIGAFQHLAISRLR